MATVIKSVMPYNAEFVSNRENQGFHVNQGMGELSSDPYQRLAFAMVTNAVNEYRGLEDAGIVSKGSISAQVWPQTVTHSRGYVSNVNRKIVGYRTFAEVDDLLDFLTNDSLLSYGFSQHFADKLRTGLGLE